MTSGRRATDEPLTGGEMDFQSMVPGRYPCEEHGEWLKKLDDRMWGILIAVCSGAIASVLTLLVLLVKKG